MLEKMMKGDEIIFFKYEFVEKERKIGLLEEVIVDYK